MIEIQDNNQIPEESGRKSFKEAFSSIAASKNSRIFLIAGMILFAVLFLYLAIFSDQGVLEEQGKKTAEQEKRNTELSKIVENVKSNNEQNIDISQDSQNSQSINIGVDKSVENIPISVPTPPAPPAPPVPPAPPKPNVEPLKPESIDMNENIGIIPPSPISTNTNNPNPSQALGSPAVPNLDMPALNTQQDAEKMKVGIMVFGGGGGANEYKSDGSINDKKSNANSDYMGFDGGTIDEATLENSSADSANATKIKFLDRTIVQGKIIDAVLESAINSDLAGSVRAIISRDIYSEYGKNILIPKGSRLIGEYDTSIKQGQTRVDITWSRLITPFGIDIQIDSKAVDPLGRVGAAGYVDAKLKEKLINAFLVSYVVPVTSAKIFGNNDVTRSTTNNKDGTSTDTTSGSAVDLALQDAGQKFTDAATEAIDQASSLEPTISVNQGTRINVFVQKDLIFSKQALDAINNGNRNVID